VELRRLTGEDWPVYRALRLQAVAEAPHAFETTLEEEERVPGAEWRARLERRVQLVAVIAGRPVGTAGLEAAELRSMWVHPEARGLGVGDALVRAVLDRARAEGAAAVALWVVDGLTAAERLYARHGFVRTGEVQETVAGDPTRMDVRMVRRLAP